VSATTDLNFAWLGLLGIGRTPASWRGRADLPSPPATASPELRRVGFADLARAEQQVAQGEQFVAEWRSIVAQRRAEGADASVSRHLLETFERDLAAHRAHRDALRKALVVDGAQAPQWWRAGMLGGRRPPVRRTPLRLSLPRRLNKHDAQRGASGGSRDDQHVAQSRGRAGT
jgi:hypothetical protein